mgnify:FL=1
MSLDYYKKAYKKELKKSAFAWGQYFQLRNELFEVHENIYNEIEDDEGVGVIYDHEHLQKFISELYAKAKVAVECAICLEKIDAENLDTTPCGHNYHKECLNTVKTNRPVGTKTIPCPICRKELWCITSK